ncbi:hypothetical protein CKA32_007047 [Geitlerinema sp. FC II]|nr:hypothetical protein CKA32_007047 [Geitlerinema sp. FC II]
MSYTTLSTQTPTVHNRWTINIQPGDWVNAPFQSSCQILDRTDTPTAIAYRVQYRDGKQEVLKVSKI